MAKVDDLVIQIKADTSAFDRSLVDHWKRTGHCLRHFSIDEPPFFCEQCGKDWKAVLDGREGRRRRRERAT